MIINKMQLSLTTTLRISEEELQPFRRQNELSRKEIESNKKAGKHSFKYFGDNYIINENVFSPKIFFDGFNSFIQGITQESVENKSLLEIGTGCGIIALHLLKRHKLKYATMTDILQNSINCAKENAEILKVSEKCSFVISDIFDNISKDKKYDIIFWNYPWLPEKDDYEFIDDLDRSLFDPGYSIIERYISDSKNFINENGKIYFGFGDFGYWKKLKEICIDYNVSPQIIYEKKGSEGGAPVKYQLVELRII